MVTICNAMTVLVTVSLPISALLVTGLALVKVGYDVYLRWVMPQAGILA